ncbi:MAG: histidyl-tRNA synthetase, partial [Cyanobacteriota bacterium]
KQFRRADRSGAPWAVVLGDGELERGVLQLKPLRGQPEAEEALPLADQPAMLERLTALVRPEEGLR